MPTTRISDDWYPAVVMALERMHYESGGRQHSTDYTRVAWLFLTDGNIWVSSII